MEEPCREPQCSSSPWPSVFRRLYPVAQACGDKFLMVGRGAKFQRAYASVYPGKVLIYARPSTDPKAAIRDPQLHRALRQAGHAVSVIEDWALLEQALKSVPVDVVLVDVAEATRLQSAMTSSPTHAGSAVRGVPEAPMPPKRRDLPAQVVGSPVALSRRSRKHDEVARTSAPRPRRLKECAIMIRIPSLPLHDCVRSRLCSAAPILALEAFAQAWVPAKGEGAVAIAFQSLNVKKHLADDDAGRCWSDRHERAAGRRHLWPDGQDCRRFGVAARDVQVHRQPAPSRTRTSTTGTIAAPSPICASRCATTSLATAR